MSIQIFPNEEPHQFDAVLVILSHQGQWVLVKDRERAWEFPGGGKEPGETYLDTANREAMEEAGAILKNIKRLGYYILPRGLKTIVVTAEVEKFVTLSGNHETEEVRLFTELPAERSFQDGLYEELIRIFNLRPQ